MDDSDLTTPTAATFNASVEALADKLAHVEANIPVPKSAIFTSNVTWTAPAGIVNGTVWATMCGGGGGGCGGVAAAMDQVTMVASGGGGAGAQRSRRLLPATIAAAAQLGIIVGSGGP